MSNSIHYPKDVMAKVNYYGGTPCTIAVGKDVVWQGGLSGGHLRAVLEMIEDRQIADIREADAWAAAGSPEPNLPHLKRWRMLHRHKLAEPVPANEQPVLPFCPEDVPAGAPFTVEPAPEPEPAPAPSKRRKRTTTKKGK